MALWSDVLGYSYPTPATGNWQLAKLVGVRPPMGRGAVAAGVAKGEGDVMPGIDESGEISTGGDDPKTLRMSVMIEGF